MNDDPGRPRSSGRASLALVAALLLPACSEGEAAPAEMGGGEFRVPVTWAVARPGEVAEAVELVGDVRTRRWSQLAFERSGRVVVVLADLGDTVGAGDVLARLDDEVLQQELLVARAAAAAARSNAEFARREAARAEGAGADILSESERDRRVSAAATTGAVAGQRNAEVGRLEAMLEQGLLKAPFDGVVVSRSLADGSYASMGATVFTLADMNRREVHLEVPPAVATSLEAGAPVELRLDERPDFALQARLDEFVPAADPGTRTFTAIVRLDGMDPARRLLPGMFVRVRFDRVRQHSQTVVPADAVLASPKGPYVVLMLPPGPDASSGGDGRPPAPTGQMIPVRVLARNAEQAAVVPIEPGPLKAGAYVVVTGADNVYPGAPLSPVPALERPPRTDGTR